MADAPKGVPVHAEKTSLVDAVVEAYGEDPFDLTDDDAEAPEGTADDGQEETPDAPEGAQPDVEDETADTDSEASDGTEDVPDRYFEVDLSGLPAEERTAVIAALKGRDDEIGKLLRGRAEGDGNDGEGSTPDPEPEPEPVTDEDILQALGIDPEFDETAAKVALPLVRGMQQLQAEVAAMREQRELADLDTYWTSELDKLEKANGELPVDRVAVLEFAAENGLQTPADAYWRIYGPAQRQVQDAVAEAQKRVSAKGDKPKPGKKDVASSRPKSSAADEDVAPPGGANLREVVKDQTAKVLRDLGIGT
jgi:hypothetical protein